MLYSVHAVLSARCAQEAPDPMSGAPIGDSPAMTSVILLVSLTKETNGVRGSSAGTGGAFADYDIRRLWWTRPRGPTRSRNRWCIDYNRGYVRRMVISTTKDRGRWSQSTYPSAKGLCYPVVQYKLAGCGLPMGGWILTETIGTPSMRDYR